MNKNGINISEKKLARLLKALPLQECVVAYTNKGLSDNEIGNLCGVTERDSKFICSDLYHKIPFKYRFTIKDNQQPSKNGNVLEGSTTGGSLIALKANDDNTRSGKVIFQDMPDTLEKVMIQSELVGNYEK